MYHKLKKYLNCRSSHQRCSLKKFPNIHRKTPALEFLFNKVAGAGLKTCNCIKIDFNKGFFCDIAKILGATIFEKICKQLLLEFLLLTVKIFSQGLPSALNLIFLFSSRSSSKFKEFSLGCSVVDPLLFEKKKNQPKQPLVVIRCTTRCHSLYHSLSFVVTRCTTRLSFYK